MKNYWNGLRHIWTKSERYNPRINADRPHHHLTNLPIITESFVLKVTGSMGNVSAIGLCIDRDGEYLYFTIFFQGPGKLFRIATGNIPELKTFLINKHN